MEYVYSIIAVIITLIIILGCYWSWKKRPKKMSKTEGVKEQVRKFEEGHFEKYRNKEGKDE